MLRLTVLGSIDLTGPNGVRHRDFLAKPKRVALLVYLAVTRPWRFHRRDTLAALFWPELDQLAARRALRQGLYVIRHDLLPDLLISRGDEEIGLDPERLRCEALEFEVALDDGNPAGAWEHYRGDFLAGFYLPNTPELERWILRGVTRTDHPILIRDADGVYRRDLALAFERNNFQLDFLFSYQPTPGTVLFAGYGSNMVEDDAFRFRGLARTRDAFFTKLSYLLRL